MAGKKKSPPLNPKQKAFIEHYLVCWNGAEAARQAGYSVRTARVQASDLLTKPNIAAAIQERLGALKMTADEVMARLADHASGNIIEFLDNEDEFSLSTGRANGKLHLIKKLKRTRRTETPRGGDPVTTVTTELELHDQQNALVQIGHILKMYGDRVEQIDLTSLTTDQLERLAKGENVYSVLAASGKG